MSDFLLAAAGFFVISAIIVGGSTAFVFRAYIWPQPDLINQQKISAKGRQRISANTYDQIFERIEQANGLLMHHKDPYAGAYLRETVIEIIVNGEKNSIRSPQNRRFVIDTEIEIRGTNNISAQYVPQYA